MRFRWWWIPALVIVALFAFAGWTLNGSNDYSEACGDAGGVPVKAYSIRVVCVDRDSLIEVS